MWLLFSLFLSVLLLATHINQTTQQWIRVTPPNLLLPLRPTLQQRIRAIKPLTPCPPLTVPLSLPPHRTTHTHTPLGSHMPSSNHTIHISLMDRSTSEAQLHQICFHMNTSHLRHQAPYAHSHHYLQCHCWLCHQPFVAMLDRTKQLPSSWTPLQSASFPAVVQENLGIICLCLSQPLAAGGVRRKRPCGLTRLPRAAALCYNMHAGVSFTCCVSTEHC